MREDTHCLNSENQLKTKMDEEIENFINDYRAFLQNNNIDIAKSTIDNTWFVYRYDKNYGYYDFFLRFTTASELVDIIIDEMRFELYCAIDKEIDSPNCVEFALADMISGYYKNKEKKTEFTVLLDMIVNSELGKNSEFFQMLNKLCRTQAACEGEKGII